MRRNGLGSGKPGEVGGDGIEEGLHLLLVLDDDVEVLRTWSSFFSLRRSFKRLSRIDLLVAEK
jgi:hypothetical protein